MRTRIDITFTPGTRSITTGITDLTIDDIRLFINETLKKVICSSMQKDNIDSISSGVVTYKNTFPVLASGDDITFEIDLGDNTAKESTLGDPSDTASDDTIFGKIKEVYEYLAGQTPEEIPEGLGDRINLLLQFFGLPQALPEYQSMPLLEMTDMLEYIMTTIDPDLTAELAAAITEEALSSDSSDDSSD